MKNYEKYDVNSLGIKACNIMYQNIFEERCGDLECKDCPLKSLETFYQWSQEEYKEPIQLTHDEYVILKNLDSRHKYIARDKNGMIEVYEGKPIKKETIWANTYGTIVSDLFVFVHLFKFIKFEDEEPYEIEKLIEAYEKENCDV